MIAEGWKRERTFVRTNFFFRLVAGKKKHRCTNRHTSRFRKWSGYLEAILNWGASYIYSWVGWNSLRTNKKPQTLIKRIASGGNSLKAGENQKKLKNLSNLSTFVSWSIKIVHLSLQTWLLWIITEKMGLLSAGIKSVLVPLLCEVKAAHVSWRLDHHMY